MKFYLTADIFVLIDKEDLNRISKYTWHIHKNRNGNSYIASSKKGTLRLLHRFIVNAPKNMLVDHINGNILDNRKENLRICSVIENSLNRKGNKNSTSKYKGVSYKTQYKKWQAQITSKGKDYHLGYFDSEIEAARIYDIKAKELHGKFARLNLSCQAQGYFKWIISMDEVYKNIGKTLKDPTISDEYKKWLWDYINPKFDYISPMMWLCDKCYMAQSQLGSLHEKDCPNLKYE